MVTKIHKVGKEKK
ncbi:hypothetical protein SNEBB_003995, partial [Seison nebaliae]